jgi:outer membrane protein TolC
MPTPDKRLTLDKLPSLEQALKMSHTRNYAEVTQNYSLILARREQLEISNEVKGHFEKAVNQAEKKFKEEDGDITQSAITKLKLGLAGTLNDISKFNSDIALAKLKLEKYLRIRWAEGVDISGPKFQPLSFPHKTVDEFLKSEPSGSKILKESGLYDLKETIIEVNKAREQLNLAGKNRKMTRALLVTEAANYDFGIGNEADLFEALIIYTRVLVGYYEALYTFNISVHHFYSMCRTK